MRYWVRRAALTTLALALLLLVTISTLVIFALYTQGGTRFVLETVEERIPGLALGTVQGRLGAGVSVADLGYRVDGLDVSVERVALRWQPGALFDAHVLVSEVELDGVTVDVTPTDAPTEDPAGFRLPESLDLPVRISVPAYSVQDLLLDAPGVHSALQRLEGTIALEPAGSSAGHSVSLAWQALSVGLPEQAPAGAQSPDPILHSASGQWRLRGTLADYATELEASYRALHAPEGSLQLTGTGNRDALMLDDVAAEVFGGALAGSGSMGWAPQPAFSLSLSATGIDPGYWDAQWPGDVAFDVQAQGSDGAISVRDLKVNGLLREQPLQAAARLDYAAQRVEVHELRGALGASRFELAGVFGDALDARWRVDSPDLSAVVPELAGTLASEGVLTGTRAGPRIAGQANLRDLRYAAGRIGALVADIDLDLTSTGEAALSPSTIRASDVRWSGWRFETLNADLTGSQPDHTLRVAAEGDSLSLNAVLRGAFADRTWQGALVSGNVRPGEFAAWTLQGGQPLALGADAQSVDTGCWASGDARLCVSGALAGDAGEGRATVEGLPWQYFAALLPETLSVEGELGGEATASKGKGAGWTVDAALGTSVTQLGERAGDDDSGQAIWLEPGEILVKGDEQRLSAQVQFPFRDSGGVRGEFLLADLTQGAQARLTGQVDASLPSLDFVAALSPEIERIRGATRLRLGLDGTLAAPGPTGEFRLDASEVVLVTPGLLLDALTVDAQAAGSGEVTLTASASAQDSVLRLEGSAQLQAAAQELAPALVSVQAQLRGEAFPFWQTEEARLWGSPDLALQWQQGRLRLDGTVDVPRARLTPTELPPGAVRVTPDQVIVAAGGEEERAPQGTLMDEFSAALEVTLGEDVVVEGFGFFGRLAGQLAITQSPGKPVLASGELNVIDGEYRAFGQGLVVDRGQLLFAGGSIDNPGLNIRAQRQPAPGIVVGVNVGGQLQAPNVDIFSEPLMSSSNQLSWLVLGRPFETTDGAEADYITQAALILGIRGGDYLARGIGEKLGVDTIGIETGTGEAGAASDVNQAALVVGKYLTPRLYVSYGVGLLDSISTVKLRYRISDRWNIETESSPVASGGDVHFSIER